MKITAIRVGSRREHGLAGHQLTDSDRRPACGDRSGAPGGSPRAPAIPAMVVASIALLVALGGTSIAAVSNVALLSVGTPS